MVENTSKKIGEIGVNPKQKEGGSSEETQNIIRNKVKTALQRVVGGATVVTALYLTFKTPQQPNTNADPVPSEYEKGNKYYDPESDETVKWEGKLENSTPPLSPEELIDLIKKNQNDVEKRRQYIQQLIDQAIEALAENLTDDEIIERQMILAQLLDLLQNKEKHGTIQAIKNKLYQIQNGYVITDHGNSVSTQNPGFKSTLINAQKTLTEEQNSSDLSAEAENIIEAVESVLTPRKLKIRGLNALQKHAAKFLQKNVIDQIIYTLKEIQIGIFTTKITEKIKETIKVLEETKETPNEQ